MTSVKVDGRVEFRFFRPAASHVSIVGDFNGWRETLAMSPADNGWWAAQINLPPGDYRFRYRADGAWYTDFASHGVEPSPLGWNSVLVVPRPRMDLHSDRNMRTGAFTDRQAITPPTGVATPMHLTVGVG